MIKLIIFDYDGVIMDSFSTVHEVYMTMCESLGKDCPEKFEDFKNIYGYNSKELIKRLGFSEEDRKKGREIFKREVVKKNPSIFKGIDEVIKKLGEKYSLVLISSNNINEVKQKLKKHGLIEEFDLIFGGSSSPMRKSPVIKKVMKQFNVSPEEVIVIGDRNPDYDKAIEAGLNTSNIILVEYGWGYDKDKIKNNEIKTKVNKPEDILKAIKEIEGRN